MNTQRSAAAISRDAAPLSDAASLVEMAPVSLYRGAVMHARMRPVVHRFNYEVTSILIDIDRLGEAGEQSVLFSIDRFNAYAFYERDHGPRDGTPLRHWVEHLLASAAIDVVPAKILLLCYPRVLGHVFNPLSIYFCYAPNGDVSALVHEVSNTFGERHAYVAPVIRECADKADILQEQAKCLYVSPFIGMDARYRFRVRPPNATVAVRILEVDADGPILAATFHGTRLAMSTGALMRMFFCTPLESFKIVGAIHFEALRLWLKGVPLHKRPQRAARQRQDSNPRHGINRP